MSMDRLPALSSFSPTPPAEADDLVRFLRERYGLGVRPETVERASDTVSSHVYRAIADPEGAVVIKRSRWFRPTEKDGYAPIVHALGMVYSVSEAIRKLGVPLPGVIASQEAELVVPWNREPTVVQSYVAGQELPFMEEGFAQAGRALARYHRVGTELLASRKGKFDVSFLPVEMSYEESRAVYLATLKDDLEKHHTCRFAEACAAIKEHQAFLEDKMAYVDASGVNALERARGWLHNDFNAGNVLVGDGGEVNAILDVDQSALGPFVWDLGNTFASFANKLRKEEKSNQIERMAAVFLSAYHREHPLPPEEYLWCLAATQRWDLMRILRGLRRHRYENDRLGALFQKTPDRLIPRLQWAPEMFGFLTQEWVAKHVLAS